MALRLQRCQAALLARQPDTPLEARRTFALPNSSAPGALCHETNPRLPISNRQTLVMNEGTTGAGHRRSADNRFEDQAGGFGDAACSD
ncbi:MAG: hypothetical protein ABGX10_05090 [Paracoccus sp. (in: a-proteobacteria)]|uniref:hypothetical protein n=1 Tax=Paracoccus sp. TaxID=267 RepID=UPI003241FE93